MVKCKICRRNIEPENVEDAFKFTLGNLKSGDFQGKKTAYYHQHCLNNDYVNEVDLPVPNTRKNLLFRDQSIIL